MEEMAQNVQKLCRFLGTSGTIQHMIIIYGTQV